MIRGYCFVIILFLLFSVSSFAQAKEVSTSKNEFFSVPVIKNKFNGVSFSNVFNERWPFFEAVLSVKMPHSSREFPVGITRVFYSYLIENQKETPLFGELKENIYYVVTPGMLQIHLRTYSWNKNKLIKFFIKNYSKLKFSKETLDKVKNKIKLKAIESKENHNALINGLFSQQVGEDELSLNLIKLESQLSKITTKALSDFFLSSFRLENMSLAFLGSGIDETKKNQLANFLLGFKNNPAADGPPFKKELSFAPKYSIVNKPGNYESTLYFSFEVPGEKSKDFQKINLSRSLLFDSYGSLLKKRIRDELRLTNVLNSELVILNKKHYLRIKTKVEHKHVYKTIFEVMSFFSTLKSSLVSPAILSEVKNELINESLIYYSSLSNYLLRVGHQRLFNHVSEMNNHLNNLNEVKMDDLQVMILKYFTKSKMIVSVVGDTKKVFSSKKEFSKIPLKEWRSSL